MFRTRKQKRRMKLILGVVLVVVVIVGADAVARRWLFDHTRESNYNFMMSHPAAYQGAAYWSPAFIDEQMKVDSTWDILATSYAHEDFNGQWYHVKDGTRRTVGQPDSATSVIYLFGSSTMVDLEVPDEYTSASILQKLVGKTWRVENMGVSGYLASQELRRLQVTPIKQGDIVVLYDGGADALRIWTQASNARSISTLCKTGSAILTALFCSGEPPVDEADYSTVLKDYQSSIDAARTYATSHGALFYHFLQPQIWSRPLTPIEGELSRVIPPGMETVVVRVWPQMQALPGTIDLTHILDNTRAEGKAVYFDPVHINDEGDAIVARAIYDTLFPVF